jgi:predicted phosphoadenosine phosphosulfate sulfurtransferase
MARQVYDNSRNVLEAARERISMVFDNFETIHVSVSGGKDSTVLAHLALVEAHKRGRKVGMFFLDEEVVYDSTVKQVDYLMTLFPENTIPLWLQIPFRLTNATSLTESQLICWEPGKHKIWMRPKQSYSIQHKPWDVAKEKVADKTKGFGFYDAISNFEACYKDTAFLVGLRATESMHRFLTMVKHPIDVGGQKVFWGTKKGANASLYPVFDWTFSDVWKYIGDQGLKYSSIYDMQFKKGVGINEMRVSSLIHEKSFHAICDLPEFEPKTYERLVERIKGIAFAQETGKASRMFAASKLPKGYRKWRDYRDFLLETYPDPALAAKFSTRFARHLENEFVARQQVRQLVLNDYENNLPVANKEDPREALVRHYMEVL